MPRPFVSRLRACLPILSTLSGVPGVTGSSAGFGGNRREGQGEAVPGTKLPPGARHWQLGLSLPPSLCPCPGHIRLPRPKLPAQLPRPRSGQCPLAPPGRPPHQEPGLLRGQSWHRMQGLSSRPSQPRRPPPGSSSKKQECTGACWPCLAPPRGLGPLGAWPHRAASWFLGADHRRGGGAWAWLLAVPSTLPLKPPPQTPIPPACHLPARPASPSKGARMVCSQDWRLPGVWTHGTQ